MQTAEESGMTHLPPLGGTAQIKGAGSLDLHACTSEADHIFKLGKSNVACSQVQSIHRVNNISVSCVCSVEPKQVEKLIIHREAAGAGNTHVY